MVVFIGVGPEQVMFKQCCEGSGMRVGEEHSGEAALKSKSSGGCCLWARAAEG